MRRHKLRHRYGRSEEFAFCNLKTRKGHRCDLPKGHAGLHWSADDKGGYAPTRERRRRR